MSAAAGQVLSRPRLYRSLEQGRRLFSLAGGSIGRRWPGLNLVPQSFHQAQRRQKPPAGPPPQAQLGDSLIKPFVSEKQTGSPASPPSLAARLAEASATLHQIQGPASLARLLATWEQPLWLEDHPWLRAVGPELEVLGATAHFVENEWGPQGETAVLMGLGAIPETGSVLIASGSGPAAALPFRMRRLVVLVPAETAALSLAAALQLTGQQAPMVTWLTGPSRTADIEKVLVLGAHGPQELHVVLYQTEET